MKESRYIFLDFEFNTAKKIQEIVSVGVVECDLNFNIISEYYSLVALSMTSTMDKYASQVNHITDSMLANARDFKTVFMELNDKLKLKPNDKIFTWGNDDKRTFDCCIKHHDLENELSLMSKSMFSIQKDLSLKITYNNKILSDTLSLKYIKRIYNIKGKVTHNALDDSMDLMHIYKKSLNNKENKRVIESLFLEKEEAKKKRELVKKQITNFSNEYPNGISINKLEGEIFKKSMILMSSKSIVYKNSHLYNLSKNSVSLLNTSNHKLNIIKDKRYSNIKFNFNTKGSILIISIMEKNNIHEFHINTNKNKDLVFSLLKNVKLNISSSLKNNMKYNKNKKGCNYEKK